MTGGPFGFEDVRPLFRFRLALAVGDLAGRRVVFDAAGTKIGPDAKVLLRFVEAGADERRAAVVADAGEPGCRAEQIGPVKLVGTLGREAFVAFGVERFFDRHVGGFRTSLNGRPL
ncbi:hypothetical protein [Luteibacter rhizovicinus]|uniref:hypothetical protein n=1 Tax=Luteibacter rhizovicinus TaxID=242606 RepID=UPI00062D75E3|nr:hypothetical protein [Luteibacter rhizovicinus]KLD66912.1 hypothetical protein Y883_11120 [Luteibacter rhizovicinus DSM 16549]